MQACLSDYNQLYFPPKFLKFLFYLLQKFYLKIYQKYLFSQKCIFQELHYLKIFYLYHKAKKSLEPLKSALQNLKEATNSKKK